MNFGDFLDGGNGGGERVLADISFINMPNGAISHPHLVSQTMCNSSGLSLALQTGVEGKNGEINTESSNVNGRRSRDEENESRSVSDDISGDELDAADNQPNKKKKRYHRHTPHQIQQLESLFKECPHPDEKQRLDLSRRLCLETRQVKFWFQNRRTQMKTQLERHENSLLRQENDKLRAETMQIREKMRNPMCTNCGGPAIMGDISIEEQHLRIENARLKDELDRVCALAGKFIGRPVASLDISVAQQMSFGGPTDVQSALPFCPPDYTGISSPLPAAVTYARSNMNATPMEKSMYLELALSAMNELVKMAEGDELLWIRSLEGGRDVLNYEEYSRTFNPCIGMKPNGFVTEASRESCMVIINSLALVETMMDSSKWQDMFPDLIARTSTADVISNGVGETKSGALHLIHAELQLLSPLVPVREVNFLRFCKQLAEGFWAVVDVSIDAIREISDGSVFPSSRRLPSGFIVQDMPNGHSKVTWVEHSEYDESGVHQLYRPLINSGMGFGSQRWLTALQRRCECLAMLMSSAVSPRDHTAISPGGRKSMLKLAQRMTSNFCAGVCASSIHKWNKLHTNSVDQDVRVMTRKSVDDPGEPPGIVLSAATSVWLPVSPQRLFNFLRDEGLRSEWDILSNGGPMQEMLQIPKGQDHGNCVSLLRASSMNTNQNSMLILQETSIDASGSLVVYAPVDIPAMHIVMNGGDSAYVAVLPSGFAITPDGPGSHGPNSNGGQPHRVSGSLLTVAFQILVNTLPTAKLNVESVETVNNLISCTVQKIKAALHCES